MVKRWETANQMRKWTQQIKLTVSERVNKEVEKAFRDGHHRAHPSEPELTGPLNEEQKAIVDEKSFRKFE